MPTARKLKATLISATKVIRKMRGGAQAYLIRCDDGHSYVVKFLNNPQHRRILINEWLAASLARHLQIQVPETAPIDLSSQFLAANPGVFLDVRNNKVPVPPGLHFGSRTPVDPEKVAMFDFLPDNLFEHVANLCDFIGMLALDTWAYNADQRQAVFFRQKTSERDPRRGGPRSHPVFLVKMIDHGFAFGGSKWDFNKATPGRRYFRSIVYDKVKGIECFEPWLHRIENFPIELIDSARKSLPMTWLASDGDALLRMIEVLVKRRRRVAVVLDQLRLSDPMAFRNWR